VCKKILDYGLAVVSISGVIMRRSTRGAAAAAAFLVLPFTISQADAASPLRFSGAQYNSPGSDTGSNASLNAEWIRVTNHGNRTRTMTGWTIRDAAGHVYRFPKFRLRPGSSVRLHTGKGQNTRRNLYWGSGWYIWNNTGDKALLKNRAGVRIDVCRWGNGPGFASC
jgi:hypothetical protein